MPLPVVLAGPIVRRVEPRRCSVWVALKSSANLTLRVWEDVQVAAPSVGSVVSGNAPVASGTTATRPFGNNLHIAVVTAEATAPNPPLLPGSLYSYDLEVDGKSLRDLQLLRDEPETPRLAGVSPSAPRHLALGYAENRLPAFMTPSPQVSGLRLAHASCRKAHGPQIDAMAWLDDVISETFTDSTNRPQQLFLTGDQIYADDVAGCLLPMLSAIAKDVVGATESLSVDDASGAESKVPATLVNFPADRRQRLVRELAGFTSSSAASHLLSFGEFVALYLAAWSPRVWRPLADQPAVLKPVAPAAHNAVKGHLTDFEACEQEKFDARDDKKPGEKPRTLVQARGSGFEKAKERIEIFRSTVPKVARALANCATYMIFDDHEITDDWNLGGRWRTRVYSKRLGRNVVRNGVMAYGICQAWGNDPHSFTSGAPTANARNVALLDQVQATFGTPPAQVSADPLAIDKLVGIVEGAANQQAKFHYQVEGPLHRVAVLDTRTRRKFVGRSLRPPDLLGGSLGNQLPKGPMTDGRELLIVVSPVPVLGPHLIERVGAPLTQTVGDIISAKKDLFDGPIGPCEPGGREAGVERFDGESWIANEEAFEKFLARLALHTRAIILSGDVHYGCSMTLDYWRKGVTAPDRIVQLTSSPARNQFKEAIESLLRSSANLQAYQAEPRPEIIAWKGKSSIEVPSGQSVPPGRRARMNRTPAVVGARRWPEGTSIPASKEPDWRWRLSLLRDERPDSELPTALRRPLLSTDVAEGDPVPGYRALAARHALTAQNQFDHLRQMAFTPNIGLVDLRTDPGGALGVRHTLLSRSGPDSRDCARNTVHDISLAATDEPMPTLVTESG